MKHKIILALAILFSTISSAEPARADSRSYKLGYQWASETSAEGLIFYQIKNAFGGNGKPVKRKARDWCDSMTGWGHYSSKNPASKSDWIKGCTDVVMTYTFRRGQIR